MSQIAFDNIPPEVFDFILNRLRDDAEIRDMGGEFALKGGGVEATVRYVKESSSVQVELHKCPWPLFIVKSKIQSAIDEARRRMGA